MKTEIREQVRRIPKAREAIARYRSGARAVSGKVTLLRYMRGAGAFPDLPGDVGIRLAYNCLLGREPDPGGVATYQQELAEGKSLHDVLRAINSSEECFIAFEQLGPSIHHGRGIFVRSLPPARRILDLGGSSTISDSGAFVLFDYPYPFEELTIVELPAEERHELYRGVKEGDVVETRLGPVRYRYHSMVDLTGFPDDYYDLVYAGQAIEHVTPSEADTMLGHIRRVLRPGGYFAFDTPNGTVCRVRQDEFIDPDHKVEYTDAEVMAKVEAAGLAVVRRHGLNWAGPSMERKKFDDIEVARRTGLFDDLENSYILCYVCQKPA